MSAPSCPVNTPVFSTATAPATSMRAKPMAPKPVRVFAKLLAALHDWRIKRRMRNLAADMDPHIMQDVGVPDWLVNECTVQRELHRLRDADYMRW